MDISILILTADRKACLQRLVAALCKLAPRNFEAVFVVGKSQDDTHDYLTTVRVPFPIQILKTDSRILTVNRNLALRAARCPLVLFIDDDALPVRTDWHQCYVDFFEKSPPTLVMAGGPSLSRDGEDESFRPWPCVNHLGLNPDPLNAKEPRLCYAQGNNMALRLEPCLKAGGFDEFIVYYHEEPDLALRLERMGYTSDYLSENTVYHFASPNLRRMGGEPQFLQGICSGIYYSLKHYKHLYPGLFLQLLLAYRKSFDQYYILNSGYSLKKAWTMWRSIFRHAFQGIKTPSRQAPIHVAPRPDSLRLPPARDLSPFIEPMTLVVGLQGFNWKNFLPGNPSGQARMLWDLCHQFYLRGHDIIFISDTIPRNFLISIGWRMISARRRPLLEAETDRRAEKLRPFAFAASVAAAGLELGPRTVFFSSQWDAAFAPLIGNGRHPVVTYFGPLRARALQTGQLADSGNPAALCLLDYYQAAYADGLIAGSRKIGEDLGELYGLECSLHPNFKVIPPGSYQAGYHFEPLARKKLLWVARLHPLKGIEEFLELIPRFLEKYPDWQVDIVGGEPSAKRPSPYPGTFLKKYRQAPWISRVVFHGIIAEMALHYHYATADLYVLPSQSGSFFQTILEARSYGVPVVTYAAPGLSELVTSGLDGILVPLNDPSAFARAVFELADNAGLRMKMGHAARESSKRNRLETFADEMEKVFDTTLRNFSPARQAPGLGTFIAENEDSYRPPFLQQIRKSLPEKYSGPGASPTDTLAQWLQRSRAPYFDMAFHKSRPFSFRDLSHPLGLGKRCLGTLLNLFIFVLLFNQREFNKQALRYLDLKN